MTQVQGNDARRLARTKTPGIYKRGNRYVAVVKAGGRQVKRYAPTLAAAREIKAQLQADVARGEYRQQSRVTFEAYAREWLGTYAGRTTRGLRETTRAEYRRAVEQRAIPFFGRRRLAEVEPRDVKAYVAHVAASGVSRNTVRLALAPVRALFATAVEDGLVRSNPCTGVRLPAAAVEEADQGKAKALTEQQLQALLAAAPPQWRLLFRFLADTGLRIGEALALTWAHVDMGRRRVQVRRRVYEGQYAPPKSRYGRRDVPISEGLARELWRLRQATRAADTALLWAGKDGAAPDPSTAYRAVKTAAKKAGVPWAGLHTLRHTAGTRWFRAGANPKQVQLLLGHHSPAFTLDTYVHLLPDDLPDAAFLDCLQPGVALAADNAKEASDEHVGAAGEARDQRREAAWA